MKCIKCNKSKPEREFRIRKGKPIICCSECENAYQREYYEANKEKIRKRKREYDTNGKLTYREDNAGHIEGNKQTIEIDGVKYSADQVRERIAELKPMQDS